jgi:EmrB/QacA subfamily drug resistance transporter
MARELKPSAVLLVTTLSSFLTSFSASAVNVALPSIGRELHASAVTLNWVVTSFLLVSAMAIVPMGRIADLVGRKRVFTVGIAVIMVTSLVAALSHSVTLLLAARAVQGLGGAMLFATSIAIAVSVFPRADRGRVIGLNTAAVYAGLSAGPPLGGLLTHAFGWPSTFLINVVAGPFILLLIATNVPGEWREAHGERFDAAGSALYAGSLAALLLGVNRLQSLPGVALTVAGVAGLAAFVALEHRTLHPVLNVKLFSGNRAYALSNLAAMINYSATSAVAYFLSLYLQGVRGLDARSAGLAMLVQPALMAVLSPVAGRLSDRVEPRLLASSGMALSTGGLLMLVFLTPGSPLAYVEAALVLLGIGFAFFSSPNMNAIVGSAGPRNLGVANSTLATMRVVGQLLSMAFTLLLVSLIMGPVQLGPTTVEPFQRAMHACFVVFSVLCAGGIFASLARGRVHD